MEVSEKVFSSVQKNKSVSHVLYSQIANSKPRVAKTKQRNEIIGSTAKIYAQKGTGNARHSSRKAPLFVGGGVAHGPKGNVYKVRRSAQGVWSCTCAGYGWRRKCRHIEETKKN